METQVSLQQQHILLELESSDRFAAYDEILRHLSNIGALPNDKVDEFKSILYAREELNTFAVGKNVAIPHINGTDLKHSVFCYARSTEGLECDSCDTGLVHHLFLALIPEKQKCGWLKTLTRTAKTLCERSLRDELMAQSDPKEVANLLQDRFVA